MVIGSYNRRLLLEHAVESVRAHAQVEGLEILIVDGGSTDGSVEWLVAQKDLVTIVQHNRGEFRGQPIRRRSWGYFMNLGFRSSQGTYVLMLSDDCLLLPGAVESALQQVAHAERAGRRVGGAAFYFRNWPGEREYYVQRTLGGKLFVNHGLYARAALEAVGFADERTYLFYKADGDLCLRMWQAGFEIIDCPDAFVEHYFNPAEEVRQSNNLALDHDRAAYLRRWEGIFYHPDRTDARGRLTRDFTDPARTAERVFGPLLPAAAQPEISSRC